MTKVNRLIAVLTISLATLVMAGCPPSSMDKWQKAATVSNALVLSVEAAQNTEIGFYNANLETAAEHIRVEQGFKTIAMADKKLNDAILAGSVGGATAAFDSALATTDLALSDGTFTVSNPTANAAIHGSILATEVIIKAIGTIGKGK